MNIKDFASLQNTDFLSNKSSTCRNKTPFPAKRVLFRRKTVASEGPWLKVICKKMLYFYQFSFQGFLGSLSLSLRWPCDIMTELCKWCMPATRSPISDTWKVKSSGIASQFKISHSDPFEQKSVKMQTCGGSIQAPINVTKWSWDMSFIWTTGVNSRPPNRILTRRRVMVPTRSPNFIKVFLGSIKPNILIR